MPNGGTHSLHWGVHTLCATFGTTAIGLVLAGDMSGREELAHWGALSALLACVLACVVICDRYARKITTSIAEVQADAVERQAELMVECAKQVTDTCNDQTREIAEETSRTVLAMVGDDGPRRIR